MTRGELALVLIIFGLIYASGLLPKIAARLAREVPDEGTRDPKGD